MSHTFKHIVPTVLDAQRKIDEQNLPSKPGGDAPLTVDQVLLCYTLNDGFELYAVTNGAGGFSYEVDGKATVTSVNRQAPLIEDLLHIWIGETLLAEAERLLLAGVSGTIYPDDRACTIAIDEYRAVLDSGGAFRKLSSRIGADLAVAIEDIAINRSSFLAFPEMGDAIAAIDADLETLGKLIGEHQKLSQMPAARQIDTLFDDIARESERLAEHQQLVAYTLTAVESRLTAYRERYRTLDAERWRLAEWRRAERDRVAAAYNDALRDPSPIDYRRAKHEYDETTRLLASDPRDTETLYRRLRTLRLRCRKSIADESVFAEALQSLVEDMEDRLGIVPGREQSGAGPGREYGSAGFQRQPPTTQGQLDLEI